MKSRDDIAQMRIEAHPINGRRKVFLKLTALSVPAMVMISALFFPLREFVRQALIGVILIWIYTGAMIGFSFLE